MLQIKNNPVLQSIIHNQKNEIQNKELTKVSSASRVILSNNQVVSQKPLIVKKTIKSIQDLTKTGFDGYSQKKNNQDSFFIYSNFMGNPESYYIGVWYFRF